MPVKTCEQTIEACKQSVKSLGIDAIDLYIIHAPFAGKEGRIEQWKGCVECQKLGLAKSIGVSNFGLTHLRELADAGLPAPAANQLELHPLTQKAELLSYMREHKITPIAYSSLAPLSNWRGGYERLEIPHVGTKTAEEATHGAVVGVIAERLGISQARILLRYSLQKGWACLPKSTKRERVKENLDLDSFVLSEEDMAALDALECNANLAWDAPPGEHYDLTQVP